MNGWMRGLGVEVGGGGGHLLSGDQTAALKHAELRAFVCACWSPIAPPAGSARDKLTEDTRGRDTETSSVLLG